ncbi:leucine-rich repeat and fibronectin type III domain-containing protein 1 [Pyrgilauda ruficollis]|uniref:leucine-rich repeat and fibronectin type III domain-containing protein 1 n=1 Tax=Pyrgilauda ruficollis TaxID=221976 RepID=UPI001B884639|nr:leucine-rich repeat and fibronectin type III domain-containing protein 1 [Pyrgilauda ruficollis]
MAKLLVPLVMLGAVSGPGVPASPPSPRCPPRCLCPAAAPSPTLLCARTGLLAVPPSLDRGAVELRLADNFIGAVGRADFANMSSLVHLTLSRNGLRRLAPGAFADLRALRALHLDGNRLPALSGPQLRGLASLRHLILANNQLAAIDAAAFAAFAATVEDLDLSHNNLPALPWDAVAAMGSLATLTLDHNLLERVPAGAVARLPRLARLDLTANRLRALPPVPGPPGPALAAGGNPLHCNCELLWLRRVAQPGRLETCATPAPLAGRLLGAVPEEELTCRAPRRGRGDGEAAGAAGDAGRRVRAGGPGVAAVAALFEVSGGGVEEVFGGSWDSGVSLSGPGWVFSFLRGGAGGLAPPPTGPRPLPRLLPPSSRTFVLRDLAPGRQYELCVSALRVAGDPPAAPRPLGCVSFATAAAPPGCAAPPRPHFLGGTVIIVIGAAIAASVLVFILILTARWKAAGARRPPPALTSVCSQTNGGPRPAETPELPPLPPLPPTAGGGPAAGGARGLFPSHSYPRRARPRRHGSLPRLDAPEGTPLGPPLRPSFGSTHWMLESTV